MARFDFEMPDRFMKQFEKLGDVENIAPKMLEAGGKELVLHVKRNIKRVIRNKAESTGALVESIKLSKPKQNKDGDYAIKVLFAGKDKRGHPNIVKAAGLEYGNSHQTAAPFVSASIKDAEDDVINAMQEAFNTEADIL